MPNSSFLKTRYGTFTALSKHRLDLTYDYEDSTLIAFAKTANMLGVNYFFDIGANIGCYSVYLSTIESIKRIFAFEPAPASYRELNKNIALQSDSGKFNSFDVALSDTKNQVKFLIISEMSGANKVDDGSSGGKSIDVSCEPLDSLVQLKNQKIAFKVDVEGHELHTLAGMTKLLKNNQCLLQVECLEEHLVARVKKVLNAHGYLLAFALRDDYIFLSASLAEAKDAVQQIYFDAVKDDLRDLLALRTYKRRSFHRLAELLAENGYPYDPVSGNNVT